MKTITIITILLLLVSSASAKVYIIENRQTTIGNNSFPDYNASELAFVIYGSALIDGNLTVSGSPVCTPDNDLCALAGESDTVALATIATLNNLSMAQITASIGNWSGNASSYSTTAAIAALYYNKTAADARYLQSYTDTNNLTTGITFTGTTTKTLNLARQGLANLTATFTDIDTDTYNTSAQMIAAVNNTLINILGNAATVTNGLYTTSAWGGDLGGSGLNPSVTDDSHAHSNTTVSSLDWTKLQTYPAACNAGNAITALGDTPTCAAFWDAFADVPTAAVTNGDTTHLSTADAIYDFVVGQGYLTSYTESDPIANAKIATLNNLSMAQITASIGNWSADKASYYLASNPANYITAAQVPAAETDSAHDQCSEISGCVVGAITDGNTNWDNSYGLITLADALTLGNWSGNATNYYTKTEGDARYLQSFTESDPVWTTDKPNYVTTASTSAWDKDASNDFDGTWASLSGKPAGFSDDVDNDTWNTTAQMRTAVNGSLIYSFSTTGDAGTVDGEHAVDFHNASKINTGLLGDSYISSAATWSAKYGSGSDASFNSVAVTTTLNADSGTLFVNSTSDRVGINVGASVPSSTLDVHGNITGEGYLNLTAASGTAYFGTTSPQGQLSWNSTCIKLMFNASVGFQAGPQC